MVNKSVRAFSMTIACHRAISILVALATILNTNIHASASDAESTDSTDSESLTAIEKTTNEIVRLELKLMKLGTQFHLAWLKPSKWKPWRVFVYKIAGSGLTNAGIITIAGSRFQYANNPAAAPRPYLEAGHIVNLVAASVVVGGTLTEGMLDHISERRLSKEGFDSRSTLSKFLELRGQLDKLLEKRDSLVKKSQSLTVRQQDILAAENLVLIDIRELITWEFSKSYCDVARFKGARNLSTATTLFGASTAGYMGSLNSLLSVANRQPKQTGVAGLGFITSGSSVAAAPLITKWGSESVERRASRKLSDSGITASIGLVESFDSHRQKLQELIATTSESDKQLLKALDARGSIYTLHNLICDGRNELRTDSKIRAKRELTERLVFSTVVGGTNIARGSQLAVAGFHFYDSPKDAFKLVASASTVFITGSSVWTADNIQGKVREELLKKKLAGTKLSVHANLIDDLNNLEQMEDQMSIY